MKTISLETFAANLEEDTNLLKEFKDNYRPIDPFETLKVLSEGKEIARLVESDTGTKKYIQSIRLKKMSDNFKPIFSHELIDHNGHIVDGSILKEILRIQFYEKR